MAKVFTDILSDILLRQVERLEAKSKLSPLAEEELSQLHQLAVTYKVLVDAIPKRGRPPKVASNSRLSDEELLNYAKDSK